MTKHILTAFAAASLAAMPAAAQPAADFPAPERTVEANAVVSQRAPAIRVVVPDAAVYLGAVRWPLYDVADAELHVFVEADEHRLVERFYWIQFEAYLPSRPDAHYDYPNSNPETVELSGYTVHVGPGFGEGEGREVRPGSDSEAFRRMITENGYRLPNWIGSVRFVYLPTEDQREELMLIYGENLDPTALTMAEAMRSGAEGISWDELTTPLVARALQGFRLEPPASE